MLTGNNLAVQRRRRGLGWFFFCLLFSNIMFLLLIWEFHIMHPGHTYFLVLPGLPLLYNLVPSPSKTRRGSKKGKKKNHVHFVLLIHSLEDSLAPRGQPLKENWVLPHPHPCQEPLPMKSIPYHHSFFFLICSTFFSATLPASPRSQPPITILKSVLQRPPASAQTTHLCMISSAMQTNDINKTHGYSADHRHQHGLRQQHRLRTSAWPNSWRT